MAGDYLKSLHRIHVLLGLPETLTVADMRILYRDRFLKVLIGPLSLGDLSDTWGLFVVYWGSLGSLGLERCLSERLS